ncbi:MAG: hypothetical protein BWY76_01737 [bacterium ADurb.Bin429]|nr:MAG: hypothetical protein BWY76_01737 [bacterium ADurb.Bin429]
MFGGDDGNAMLAFEPEGMVDTPRQRFMPAELGDEITEQCSEFKIAAAQQVEHRGGTLGRRVTKEMINGPGLLDHQAKTRVIGKRARRLRHLNRGIQPAGMFMQYMRGQVRIPDIMVRELNDMHHPTPGRRPRERSSGNGFASV